jgi:protein-S-isoprenylcysteine O-methyltransferase Ste14
VQSLASQQTLRWLWLVWVLYWFGSGLRARRTVKREPMWQRMSTTGIMIVAVSLLGYMGWRLGLLDKRFVPDTEAVRTTGLLLTLAGMAITVWARIHLGQFWSARVTIKEGHELIQTGPYAWVRHPIYSGLLVAVAGSAVVIGAWRALLGVALVWLGLRLKAAREERLLSRQFGSAFTEYRRRTGALIPKLFSSVTG